MSMIVGKNWHSKALRISANILVWGVAIAIYCNIGYAYGQYMHHNVIGNDQELISLGQKFFAGGFELMKGSIYSTKDQITVPHGFFYFLFVFVWPIIFVMFIFTWLIWIIYQLFFLIFAGGIFKIIGIL